MKSHTPVGDPIWSSVGTGKPIDIVVGSDSPDYRIQEGPAVVMARRDLTVNLHVNRGRMRHLEQYWYARYWRAPKSDRAALIDRAARDITAKCVRVAV